MVRSPYPHARILRIDTARRASHARRARRVHRRGLPRRRARSRSRTIRCRKTKYDMKLHGARRRRRLHRPACAAAGRQGAPRRRGGRDGGGRDQGAGARCRRGGRGRLRGAALRLHTEDAMRPAPRRCGTRCRTTCWSTRCSATARRPTRRFAAADHVVSMDFHIGRVTGVPMEPRAALGALRRGHRPLHALCRQRRRGAPEGRALDRARHRARASCGFSPTTSAAISAPATACSSSSAWCCGRRARSAGR